MNPASRRCVHPIRDAATFSVAARIALCLASLSALPACSGADDPTLGSVGEVPVASPTTSPSTLPPTVVALTVPDVAPILSSDLPPITFPPYDTSDIPVVLPPLDSSDLPVIITVVVGGDGGDGAAQDRTETVGLGMTVSVTIVNPDIADEFHLHGYELGDGDEVPKGQSQTFTFVADRPGTFELESHVADDVLMLLRVV